MIIDQLEDARVFSKLSDRIHYHMYDNKRYACFSGYIIPYSLSKVLELWCLYGSNAYGNIINNTELLDTLKALNPSSSNIQTHTSINALTYDLYTILLKSMSTWEPHHYDEMIASHIFA